jgi:hypothetical protein
MFLSPTLAQTAGGKNVLTNGSFDKLDKAGKSTGWNGFSPNAKLVKETRAGGAINHYVVVAPNHKGHAPYVTSQLQLKPQWKTLRISARMKASKVKMGAQGWQGPRLSLNFQGCQRENSISNWWPSAQQRQQLENHFARRGCAQKREESRDSGCCFWSAWRVQRRRHQDRSNFRLKRLRVCYKW